MENEIPMKKIKYKFFFRVSVVEFFYFIATSILYPLKTEYPWLADVYKPADLENIFVVNGFSKCSYHSFAD